MEGCCRVFMCLENKKSGDQMRGIWCVKNKTKPKTNKTKLSFKLPYTSSGHKLQWN